MKNKFYLNPADNFIWNKNELLSFLIEYQGSNIMIDTNGEGCCLTATGVYEMLDRFRFTSVVIKTNNLLEHHNLYRINHGDTVTKFFSVPNTNYTQHHRWTENKLFGALYNRASWHRIGLASYLLNQYPTKTLLNFRGNPMTEDSRKLFELQRLFELDPKSVEKFMLVYKQLPIQLEDQDGYTVIATTQMHTDQLAHFYPDFLIDIVAETFITGCTFYPTEKIVRPMLLKKSFIAMGPRNFLCYLRQLGFKTFNNLWNEDYDGYEGKERYIRILRLIDDLVQRTDHTQLYTNMQDILTHNYNLLVNKNFNTKVTYLD